MPEVPAIHRHVVRMDGFPGAPGYMTFYTDGSAGAQPAVVAFVTALRAKSPSDVTFSVPNEGDIIDAATGAIAGSWTEGTATLLNGLNSGVYAAPVGACISWNTGQIVGRRRLRGRTFLVPLGGSQYDSDGSIFSGSLSDLRDAASALWVSAHLVVWHRPDKTTHTGGVAWPVTGSTIADRAAVLRSRRA